MRHASRASVVAIAVGASVSACGLALGIDDIPPVPISDAGSHVTHDAHDAHAPVDAVVDAKPDRGVDARADRTVDATEMDAAEEAAPVGQLPQRSGPETTSTQVMNFALNNLWLGDTTKDDTFTASESAWATFGYNIDGKVTTSISTDVCTLANGALSNVQIDGQLGADNSFGENLVGDLSLVFSGLSKTLTTDIQKGSFTFLLDTTGLTSDPAQSNVGLTTEFFGGASLGATPTFTLADNWPVDPRTLADGVTLANGAKISLSNSFVTGGTWVSGDPADFIFTFQVDGVPLALIFHEGVAVFQHTIDDAGANHAINGIVAGILEPSEFIGALQIAGGSLSNGEYCPEVNAFASRILVAQDILLDGTNTEGKPCNGISVALAFTADQIQPPSVVAPTSARDGSMPTCAPDGGARDASDASP
jgi:hypothetical protein